MGRLDDAAKRKVVELRKNGLSFRKIKAVLELENIKVSAQAIYLFLKEFQGKQGTEEGAPPLALVGTRGRPGGRREGWSNLHLQQLLLRHGYVAATEAAKQSGPTPEAGTSQPSGSGTTSGESRPERPGEGTDDKDIQIVSVTSLAQRNQLRGVQPTVQRAGSGTAGVTVTGAYMRRRVTPSPATNPILAARKRLLDKALSHRMRLKESYQQVASVLRKDQSNSSGPDAKRTSAAQPQPQSYDPSTQRITQERRTVDGQPGGAGVPRRLLPPMRSPHHLPRVGIRLPSPAPAVPTSQGPCGPVIQLQTTGQGPARREGAPSPQQLAQKAGARGAGGGCCGGGSGLQEQVQALGSEVHSLGLAVRMLAEQQVQQTQVQRQILSTLQTLAARSGPCISTNQQQPQQPQHTKTSSPLSLPASAPGPNSYTQNTFTYSQGTYPPQCSQAQPGFPEINTPSLDTIQVFKLPGLSPSTVNGFPACSSGESIPLTHASTPTEPYTPTYTYSQPYVPAYSQSHAQTYREAESEGVDYRGACAAGTLRDCSAASQPALTPDSALTLPSQDHQINIIKVETL